MTELCGCEGVPCSENAEVDPETGERECGSCAGPCHPYEDEWDEEE